MNFKLLLSVSLLCTISMCGNDIDQFARALKDIVADSSSSGIVSYDPLRDRAIVLEILKPDALFLVDGAKNVDSAMKELEDLLDYKTPYPETHEDDGTLLIDVYRDNGKTAGVIAYCKDEVRPYIGNIVIVAIGENYRRRGYAEKLFNHAIQYFKDQNCIKVKLGVNSDNKKAQNLYEKLGFTCIKKSKNTSFCELNFSMKNMMH